MLKTLITVSTVLLTTAAFAQGTKSPGSSEYAPGQKMQDSKSSTTKGTTKGASKYAPGHQKKTAKGHSESAPGHQTTTGSATTKKKY